MASSISRRRAGRRHRVATTALLLVCVVPRGGRAADETPRPETDAARQAATARLIEGVELLRTRQYHEALARFDEAYALVPSANIHYDRGLAYRGLGRNAAAIEAFEAFLAGARQPPAGKR